MFESINDATMDHNGLLSAGEEVIGCDLVWEMKGQFFKDRWVMGVPAMGRDPPMEQEVLDLWRQEMLKQGGEIGRASCRERV